jgi:hypothetical protein
MEKAVLRKMEIAELGGKLHQLYRTYRWIIGIVQAISEVSL